MNITIIVLLSVCCGGLWIFWIGLLEIVAFLDLSFKDGHALQMGKSPTPWDGINHDQSMCGFKYTCD